MLIGWWCRLLFVKRYLQGAEDPTGWMGDDRRSTAASRIPSVPLPHVHIIGPRRSRDSSGAVELSTLQLVPLEYPLVFE